MVLADRTFKLTSEQTKAFRESKGRVQLRVGCMLLGDTTQYRFHWPLHASLRINKIPYRVYGRGSSSKLGVNGRDDTFSVGKYSKEGTNTVMLQAVDSRPFVLLVAKVRERSDEEVRALMAPRESLEAAHGRMVRAVNGGHGAGDDSDDDIVTLSTVISLKCPLTGMRVKVRRLRLPPWGPKQPLSGTLRNSPSFPPRVTRTKARERRGEGKWGEGRGRTWRGGGGGGEGRSGGQRGGKRRSGGYRGGEGFGEGRVSCAQRLLC